MPPLKFTMSRRVVPHRVFLLLISLTLLRGGRGQWSRTLGGEAVKMNSKEFPYVVEIGNVFNKELELPDRGVLCGGTLIAME